MITSARSTTRQARRLRSSLLASLLAACAVVAPAIANGGMGTAHADMNGYTAVCPGMLLKVGQASVGSCWGTTILAQTAFQASESLAGTPNPSVDWGDGTVNTLATPPSMYADRPSNCDQPGSEGAFGPFPGFGPVTCRLFDQHTYTAPGIYTVAITYYTGFAIHYTATTRAVVSDGGSAPIGRYFAPGIGHWVTTGSASPEYQLETVLGYALTSMDANTLPLYDCLAGASYHFVSLDAGCEGQHVGPRLGYVYSNPSPYAPTHPIYRCYTGIEHFVSIDAGCEGQQTEERLGYALSQPASQAVGAPSQHW